MKILLIDKNHESLKTSLEALGCVCDENYQGSKEDIEKQIETYEGIVIRSRFQIDASFLAHAKKLKFIARVGSGIENIDVQTAHKKGIEVINAPEANAPSVAEHVLGMLLSLFNNLKKASIEIENGMWLREPNRGIELSGKKVGLIGYGNTGKAFARVLKGFNTQVFCYDIKEDVGDENATQVSLKKLQEEAEIVSLHISYSKESHHFINHQFIEQVKKPFYFINTARGKSVHTEDLVTAIKNEKILGACLDVLEFEENSFEVIAQGKKSFESFNFLKTSPKVLLTPHIAGWTHESKLALSTTIVQKIERLFFNPPSSEKSLSESPKVTGIGGLFFKSKNPKKLKAWYQKHLGFEVDDWGCLFSIKDKTENILATTQWSPFEEDTKYFKPSEKSYMFNYRVNNLYSLIDKLKDEGVNIVGKIETYDYGKFAWITDNEGNKIELWEPIDEKLVNS